MKFQELCLQYGKNNLTREQLIQYIKTTEALYELDLTLLGIEDVQYGKKLRPKDIYVFSKETGNVYYLEGIKFSLIIIPLFIIIALILDLTIRIRIIIYYIIIFITSTLGSMIGINTKRNCN